MTVRSSHTRTWRNRLWLAAVLLGYLALTLYQLGLPGLHYDEAREAGVNAMEILTGAPLSLFRNTGITLFGQQWPIMVQDYIGAANVYLALPFLWLTGIGVPNLRIVAILLGLVTLLLVERTVAEWQILTGSRAAVVARKLPLATPGLLAVTLLAVSPSFIFWSRQGIFVTNLTEPLVFAMLWQGIRWLRCQRARHLLLAAFFGGAALYAKLLAIWLVGPFILLLGGWWTVQNMRHANRPRLDPLLTVGSLVAFVVPLLPLLWFNVASGGTIAAVTGHLGTSYYGVNNLAIGENFSVRLSQFRQMITGDHFWYLGGLYANPLAWWATVFALLLGAILGIGRPEYRVRFLMPLLLLAMALGASLFTLSDLFVTHYALLQPVTIAVVAIILYDFVDRPLVKWMVYGLALFWLLFDLTATVRYHRALTQSGGLADHADSSYHLAYYLQYNGLGAPLALDWGFDAPIRYLSSGTVTPIELFGYGSLAQPATNFQEQLKPFLANSANVYLLHAPEATVFDGRREQFFQLIAEEGRQAELVTGFAQRDGTPLYEVWRVVDAGAP